MLPFHPTVAHLPIVISFIIPVLVLVFALMIKNNKMTPSAWLVIVGLQVLTTVSGYIALESGEVEETTVEKVVEKKLIQAHEEAAELFVGTTVLSLVLGIAAFFIRKEFQFHLKLAVLAITIISAILGCRAGDLGGDLVYKHGAASAYNNTDNGMEGILPTPGENTSESSFPVDEDENHYAPPEDDAKDEE